MFRKNSMHIQSDFFAPENRLPEQFKKKLTNHWTSLFYLKVFSKIREEDFSQIYSERMGRPNFPINILVALDIIKDLHDYTDEKLYEDFFLNSGIQMALGIEDIGKYYFSIRTWYNFRSAMGEYEENNNIELLRNLFSKNRDEMIGELNIKTDLQRRDSVFVAANIKRMNRLMLFHKVLSNFARLLEKLEYTVTEEIKSLVKRDEDSVAYKIKKDEVSSMTKKIGNHILDLFEIYKNNDEINQSKEYKQAERLIQEQCNVEEKKSFKALALKPSKDISSGSMQNPSDEDATYRKKNDEEHIGYLNHSSETCNPENSVQVITDVETTKNNIDDSVTGKETLSRIKEETDVEIMIQDGGYHSPDAVESSGKLGVTLHQTAIRGRSQKADTLNSEDFSIANDGMVDKCPAGLQPIKQIKKDGRTVASFDKRQCVACSMNSKCMAFKSEKQCQIVIDANRQFIDTRIRNIDEDSTKKLNRLRPAVEGLMEKMKPKYLKGRVVFRGLKKVKNRMIRRAIGLNFNRYVAYKNKKPEILQIFWQFIDKFVKILAWERPGLCPDS